MALDARQLGDPADRRPGGADARVEVDGRSDDPPARLLLAAGAMWLLTQSFSTQLFQRYYEPWILITLAWLGAMAAGPRTRRVWIGPVALGCVQALLAVFTVLAAVLRDGAAS
jgi:hypothetical protein